MLLQVTSFLVPHNIVYTVYSSVRRGVVFGLQPPHPTFWGSLGFFKMLLIYKICDNSYVLSPTQNKNLRTLLTVQYVRKSNVDNSGYSSMIILQFIIIIIFLQLQFFFINLPTTKHYAQQFSSIKMSVLQSKLIQNNL